MNILHGYKLVRLRYDDIQKQDKVFKVKTPKKPHFSR